MLNCNLYKRKNLEIVLYKGDDMMPRLELLTLLLSIQALLETDNVEKAKELLECVIAQAR